MSDKEPYRPEAGTIARLLTCLLIFVVILVVAGAGGIALHWMFYGR